MAKHNELGEKGEQIAERFLIKNGYEILEKNWRYKHLEVDILALKDNCLVAIEVKTRSYEFVESYYEIVPRKKQLFVIKATDAYIQNKELDNEVRFDIIFIVVKNDNHKLEHVVDAFSAVG